MKELNSYRRSYPISILLTMISICLIGAAATGQEQMQDRDYKIVPAKPGEKCTICNVPLSEDDVAVVVRGRRVPLKSMMVDSFMHNQEQYFAKKQPKGALFQEELSAPAGVALGGISFGWFLFGSYVLVALLSAGLSGYVGISKGLAPIPHFFIGLVFSLFGLIYVLTRKPENSEEEVPPGLVKVPATRAPVACPVCGNTNHPSARECSRCGEALSPQFSSEVDLV